MGMDMVGITVGGYQHFISRPCLRRKRQCDRMSLVVGDILFRSEGLHILVKADAVIFIPCRLGGFKLCNGVDAITVDTAN